MELFFKLNMAIEIRRQNKTKHWKNTLRYAPEKLQAWIADPRSFMRRLENHGIANTNIQVLRQCYGFAEKEEKQVLNLPFRQSVFIREVLISTQASQWMYARTVIPLEILSGSYRQLIYLKNRSLGSVLFQYPPAKRRIVALDCLTQSNFLYQQIGSYTTIHAMDLWARSSLFDTKGHSLLLTEVFLPDLERL